MDWFHSLQMFIQVAEMKSFSEVARQEFVSTSSVSRQISTLENKLGVKLFQRTTRAVHLTEAGEIYYCNTQKILKDLQSTNEAISQLQDIPQGSLTISMPIAFGRQYLVPLLPNFCRQYPKITVSVDLNDSIVNLLEEKVDVAVRIGDFEDSRMRIHKLGINQRIICASPSYIKKYGKPTSPQDLKKHTCLFYKFRHGGDIWSFRKGKKVQKIRVSGSVNSNSSEVLLDMATAGIGVVLLATWAVKEEIEKGNLQILLPEYEATPTNVYAGGIYIVSPYKQFLPPKLKVFLNFFRDIWQHALQIEF